MLHGTGRADCLDYYRPTASRCQQPEDLRYLFGRNFARPAQRVPNK